MSSHQYFILNLHDTCFVVPYKGIFLNKNKKHEVI